MRRIHWIYWVAALAILSTTAAAGELYHMVRIEKPSADAVKMMAQLGLPLDDAKKVGDDLEIPLSARDLELAE